MEAKWGGLLQGWGRCRVSRSGGEWDSCAYACGNIYQCKRARTHMHIPRTNHAQTLQAVNCFSYFDFFAENRCESALGHP